MAAMDKPWLNAWVDDDGSGTTGTIWNKARITELADGFDGIAHGAQLTNTADVAMGTDYNFVPVGTVDYAFNAGYVGGPGYLLIPAAQGGLYLVTASLMWVPGTGIRGLEIRRNGIGVVRQNGYISASHTIGLGQSASGFFPMVGGDYFQLYGYSDTATSIYAGARFGLVRV